jgi:hypothetical protein
VTIIDRQATYVERLALSILVLTSVHHAYGAYVYQTTWRYHVLLISIPAAIAIVASYARLRAKPESVAARWVFGLTTFLIAFAGIGVFEGLYNHVVKDALYFAGTSRATMLRLFPPPAYEMPNDFFFELTGVLQGVLALPAGYFLARFVRAGSAERTSLAQRSR